MLPRPSSTSNYAGLVSPVTPMWASNQEQRSARRLLPSAIEISTPPNTIGRRSSKFSKKRKAPHDEFADAPEMPSVPPHGALASAARANPPSAAQFAASHPGGLFNGSDSQLKPESMDRGYRYNPTVGTPLPAPTDRYPQLGSQPVMMPSLSPAHEMHHSHEFLAPQSTSGMYKYPQSPSHPPPSHHHPPLPPSLGYPIASYPSLPPPSSLPYTVPLPDAKLSRDGILSSPGHPISVSSGSPSFRSVGNSFSAERAYLPPSRPSLDDFTSAGLAQPPLHRRNTNYASRCDIGPGGSLVGYSLSPPAAPLGPPQVGSFPPLRSMAGPSSSFVSPATSSAQNPTFQRSMPPKRAKVMLPSHTYMDYLVARNPNLALAAMPQNDAETRDPYEEYNHYIMRHAADTKATVIWHPEVEAVFMEALWMIPGEPTKIVMNSRGRGRNELISDYVKHFLGEFRSRKQVSSHLQVLKKLLQHDEVFLDLVGPRRPGANEEELTAVKNKSVLETNTIEELVAKLKDRKQGEPKPQFLLQAERNRDISRKPVLIQGSPHSSDETDSPHSSPEATRTAAEQPSMAGYSLGSIKSSSTLSSMSASASASMPASREPRGHRPSLSADTESVTSESSSPVEEMSIPVKPEPVANMLHRPRAGDSQPLAVSVDTDYHPLLQPRPVLAENKVEPLIAPSASVPPVEPQPAAFHGSPRRNRHRRTTSASVELSGDRVLPISFYMGRRQRNRDHVYSRLLRAAYESPLRPLELTSLLPEFHDLDALHNQNLLAGVPIIHANIAIFIGESNPGPYVSDVQYLVSGGNVHGGYRYYSKMVITSRKELLRCQFPCPFQQIAGRGLEEDKDILNAPFLPDFWDDFLNRLEVSGQEYARASLAALKLFQAIYRVSNGREELAFIALSRFSVADDEFSARTRFRRVRGVSPHATAAAARNASSSAVIKPTSADGPEATSTKLSSEDEALPEPATPTPVRRHSEAKTARGFPATEGPASSPESMASSGASKDTNQSSEPSLAPSISLDSTLPTNNAHCYTGRHRRTDSAMFAQLLGTPTPYQRAPHDSRANSVSATESAINTASGQSTDTPRTGTSASLLGVDTPNLAMLGNTFSFDSPSVFASPRRFNLDNFDLGASPFTAVLSSQDPRPRSSQLDIQRPMTAFEPQAWEEMHDWIYQ